MLWNCEITSADPEVVELIEADGYTVRQLRQTARRRCRRPASTESSASFRS